MKHSISQTLTRPANDWKWPSVTGAEEGSLPEWFMVVQEEIGGTPGQPESYHIEELTRRFPEVDAAIRCREAEGWAFTGCTVALDGPDAPDGLDKLEPVMLHVYVDA